MRLFLVLFCMTVAFVATLREVIMNPEILPNLVAGAALALAFTLIGLVVGIFIGIKLEDKYDLDNSGTNYRRRKGK